MTGTDLPERAEVVVVGAGHNSLVCAAYLAKAGLEVLVLEAGPTVGGNTRTEELTLPGFAHDSCSSAHVLIQNNPLIRDDELGLVADYALRYLITDPAVVLPQPNGDVLVMQPDLEATCAELARWSDRDAAAFRSMIETWRGGLAAAHGRWSSNLPQPRDAITGEYLKLRERSAWDVVHETFQHPVVRSFVLWMAMATIQDPRRPGTGFLPSSLSAGRIDFGWTTPVGGSQALPDSLVRMIEDHGGRVVCSAPVAEVEVDGSGARAVITADGRRVGVGRALVAGGHLAQLAGMVTGAEPTADLVAARDSWRPGLSVLAVHAALRSNLAFGAAGIASTAAGYGTSDGMARHVDRHDAGRARERRPVAARREPDRRRPRARAGRCDVQDPDHRAVRARRRPVVVRGQGRVRRAPGVAGRRPLRRPRSRGHLVDADRVAGRRRRPQPAQPRWVLPRRRVPERRPGRLGVDALRHRRAGALRDRRDHAPGRLGVGAAGSQRRSHGPDLPRHRPADGDGGDLSRGGSAHERASLPRTDPASPTRCASATADN